MHDRRGVWAGMVLVNSYVPSGTMAVGRQYCSPVACTTGGVHNYARSVDRHNLMVGKNLNGTITSHGVRVTTRDSKNTR